MSDEIRDTLSARGAQYGTFMENAKISNAVLDVLRAHPGWQNFQPDQRTATEIIVQKLARALSGNAQYDDNWRDIAGYAQLIVDRINGTGTYATGSSSFDDEIPIGKCPDCGAGVGYAHSPNCIRVQDPHNRRRSSGG